MKVNKYGMHQTYRSDIGKGVLWMLMLGCGVISLLLFFLITDHSWLSFLPIGLILGYLIFLYATIHYRLTPENRLKIKAGFRQKEIDIFQISSLRILSGTFNLPNVYALSENRIRVVYGYGDYVDISPQNRERFINALLAINPRIQHQRTPPSRH